eukprot:TRINITY_DN14784_c0_g1_i1.p1 TRINITY_DN14784_c0_g1~~TRINITY_DN14784_c0_g1_i1.p1  ORF type:complete len:132 (+),score=11.54 TRINITY_DN14784_c0_g1_i1:244-639(+)
MYRDTITGRKMLIEGSILKIAETFAKETQDSHRVNSLIHAHAHFVSSEDLLEAFLVQFKLCVVDGEKTRIVNFLKKWIDLQRPKFQNSDNGVGHKLTKWVEDFNHFNDTEEEKLIYFLKTLLHSLPTVQVQ